MQLARIFRVLSVFAVMATLAHAQLPFGSGTTVIKNATVFTDGKIVENCHLLFAGKKIRAVGTDIKIPDDAEVINGKGKFIIPTLIDSSASMGLLNPQAQARVNRAHFSILDRLNMFDVLPFKDSIEQGVTHVYLRNPASRGVGGMGSGVFLPKEAGKKAKDIALEGTETIHMKLGTSTGPIARFNEVNGLKSQLLAAKKYKESWKKYDDQMKEYIESLGSKKKSSAKKPSKKKDPKGGPPKKKASAFAHADEHDEDHDDDHDEDHDDDDHEGEHADEDHDEDHDEHDEDHLVKEAGHSHDHEGEAKAEVEVFDPHAIASWDIWSLGDINEHPAVKAIKARESFVDEHKTDVPTSWRAAGPQLAPQSTFVDHDGTEPHMLRPNEIDPNDPSGIEILVCEHCGGQLEGVPHYHPKVDGFDFWEFAPDPRKKTSTKKSSKTKKKPREPRINPSTAAMADLLDGKKRLRIEVHRAEDIRNVLKILEDYPMHVTLEGVTEGYLVADELAKAEIPVIVFGDTEKPIQESGGASAAANPFARFPGIRFPRNFRGLRGGSSGPTVSVKGVARLDNAAIMAKKGVRVAIASSHSAYEASPQLLLAAGLMSGHGMDKAHALNAITTEPARILGLDDNIGSLKKGKHASFVILDGDPFNAATRVRNVYIDGKSYYKKK